MAAPVETPPARPALPRRPLPWYLGVVVTLIVTAFTAGDAAAGMVQLASFVVIGGISVIGLVAGVLLHRPRRRTGWVLFICAEVGFVAGAQVSVVSTTVFGDQRLSGYAELLYDVGYVCMVGGLIVIVRHCAPGWHAITAIDSAIIVTSAALLSWIYVLAPLFELPAVSGAERFTLLSYPLLDLVLLNLLVRLALSTVRRTASLLLLFTSFALQLVSDTAYLLQRLDGTYTNNSWVGVTYTLAVVAWTASGLHPSMRDLDRAATAQAPDATVGRLVLLGVASLIAPGVLVVQDLRGDLRAVLVIAAVCALLFVLVLARMAGVVLAQRRLALLDVLTGLYNRRHFHTALDRALATAWRRDLRVSLAVIDVDRFKTVNDTHGHDAGDDVLRVVATRLTSAVRKADLVARYGGEEFVAVLPGAGPQEAASIGERLRRSVADLPVPLRDGSTLRVTVSVGLATSEGPQDTADGLVRRADGALYAAKHTGRNRTVTAPAVPIGTGA